MPKIYMAYCAAVLLMLGVANYQGVVIASYLASKAASAAKSSSHGSGYHK